MFEVGDDVWIGDYYGTVLSVSEPFKCGNLSYEGTHPTGREVVIFIEGDEDA